MIHRKFVSRTKISLKAAFVGFWLFCQNWLRLNGPLGKAYPRTPRTLQASFLWNPARLLVSSSWFLPQLEPEAPGREAVWVKLDCCCIPSLRGECPPCARQWTFLCEWVHEWLDKETTEGCVYQPVRNNRATPEQIRIANSCELSNTIFCDFPANTPTSLPCCMKLGDKTALWESSLRSF